MILPAGYVAVSEDTLRKFAPDASVEAIRREALVFEALPEIPDRRLAYLEFQAANRGHTPERAASMLKGGVVAADLPHSITIAITASELSAMLAAYRRYHG